MYIRIYIIHIYIYIYIYIYIKLKKIKRKKKALQKIKPKQVKPVLSDPDVKKHLKKLY